MPPGERSIDHDPVDADPNDADLIDPDLIDAAEAAAILGLAHRNSVSTYRRRYEDFPEPVVSGRGAGRKTMWRRSDVSAWQQEWAGRTRGRRGPQPAARLEELVEATARLMLAHPGAEIGIRQIAAEAGIAHSDVYRYSRSKDELLTKASERLVASYGLQLPDSFEEVLAHIDELVAGALQREAGMRVIAARLINDPHAQTEVELPIVSLARMVAANREKARGGRPGAGAADDGRVRDEVDPDVVAACVAAMLWGWGILGARLRNHLGFAELPVGQIARMAALMLQA